MLFNFNGKTITEVGGSIPTCGNHDAPLYGWRPIVTDTMILLDCKREEERRTVNINRISGNATHEYHGYNAKNRWILLQEESYKCRKLQQAF